MCVLLSSFEKCFGWACIVVAAFVWTLFVAVENTAEAQVQIEQPCSATLAVSSSLSDWKDRTHETQYGDVRYFYRNGDEHRAAQLQYQRPIVIEKLSGVPLYDSETCLLRCELQFRLLDERNYASLKEEVRQLVETQGKTVEQVPLDAVEYTLVMESPDGNVETLCEGIRPGSRIPVRHRVEEPTLQELLKAGDFATPILVYRPKYHFRQYITIRFSVDSTQTALQTIKEKVFGKSERDSYVVNRRALQELKDAIHHSLVFRWEGPAERVNGFETAAIRN